MLFMRRERCGRVARAVACHFDCVWGQAGSLCPRLPAFGARQGHFARGCATLTAVARGCATMEILVKAVLMQ